MAAAEWAETSQPGNLLEGFWTFEQEKTRARRMQGVWRGVPLWPSMAKLLMDETILPVKLSRHCPHWAVNRMREPRDGERAAAGVGYCQAGIVRIPRRRRRKPLRIIKI